MWRFEASRCMYTKRVGDTCARMGSDEHTHCFKIGTVTLIWLIPLMTANVYLTADTIVERHNQSDIVDGVAISMVQRISTSNLIY